MNNKQIAHVFFSRTQATGKGSNMYFDRNTIYSYGPHFPLAIITDKMSSAGVPFLLVNTDGYSTTTAKHKAHVYAAIPRHRYAVIYMPLGNDRGHASVYFREAIQETARKMERAKTATSFEGYSFQLSWMQESLANYIEFMGLDRAEYTDLLSIAPDQQRAAELRDKQQANDEKRNASAVAEWIAGERMSIPYSVRAVYLRYLPSTEQIETSKGARIPYHIGYELFKNVIVDQHGLPAGEKVGIYTTNENAWNGQRLSIGCHEITKDEIYRFAKTQNWVV